MNFDTFMDLITNMILLLSLSVVYSLFDNEKKYGGPLSKVVLGIAVSFVGIIIMRNHVLLENGLVFDGRSVLILLAAFYFGTVPVLIGSFSLIGYRYYLTFAYNDTSGLIPGILWIIIPAILGLLWSRYRLHNKVHKSRFLHSEQYVMILLTQIIVVSLLFLFPNKVSSETIFQIMPALLIFYPIGGYLASMFMHRVRENYINQVAIKQHNKDYIQLFNSGSYCNFIIDPETRKFVNVNTVAIEKYGYTLEEFKELTTYDLSTNNINELKELVNEKESLHHDYFVTKHKLKNGQIIDVEVRNRNIEIDNKHYIYTNILDITERLVNEQKYHDVNEKLKVTLKGVNDGIIVTDEYGNIEIVNDVGQQFIRNDFFVGESITKAFNIILDDEQLPFTHIIKSIYKTNIPFSSKKPYIFVDRYNQQHYVDLSVSSITYRQETHSKGLIIILNDVTQKHIEKNQIEYISQHDHHTGLYNRYFFDAELRRLDSPRQLPITLIMGDVNGLKVINDAFGHLEGDRYLKEIATILKKATRSEDIVARWGGDEFVILLPQTSHENSMKVVNRINDLCEKSHYDIVTPSISIGVATKTDEEQVLTNILTTAEEIMYTNKQTDGKIMRHELLKNIYSHINSLHHDLKVHSSNIEIGVIEFARYLKLDKPEVKRLAKYARYHDIGWVTVKPNSIDPNIRLIDQDLPFVKKHPEIGFRIAKSVPELSDLAEFLESHKENYDGSGYPNGIKGKDIPYQCRILSIIDYIDVLRTKSYSDTEIEKALLEDKGHRFDPDLVSKYLSMKKEKAK